MSSLESALRNALAKGDEGNPIFRRKVYESAANALQKSLQAKGNVDPAALQQQNMRLAETIKKIEGEIKQNAPMRITPVLAVDSNFDQPAPPQVDPQPAPRPKMEAAPSLDDVVSAPEPRIVAEPRRQTTEPSPAGTLSDIEPAKKRPFASLLTGSIAVALLGIGLLWIITTGAFQSAEERDTSVPNPSRVLESESFEGRDPGTATAPETLGGRNAGDDEWATLFTPDDPTTLGLIDGAVAEISSDSFGDYARISTPNEVAQVQIDVPLGVLRRSGGNPLQLSIIARSDEGAPTQMSVTCDFGSVGNCGRHRFNVGQAENEFLIQIDLPNAESATAPGRINLVTDVQGEGRYIKLLGARIRATN